MAKHRIRLKVSAYLLALVAQLWLFALAAPALAQPGNGSAQSQLAPQLEYRCDAPAALFWLASALAGDSPMDGLDKLAWWQAKSGATPESHARLDRAVMAFSRMRSVYRGNFLGILPRTNPWVPLPPSSDHRLEVRFAALFLGARTGEELLQRAEVLMGERDRSELQEIAAVLLPKLASVSAAESDTCRFAKSFEAYARRSEVGDFLRRAGRLFDAAPGGALTVQFVPALAGEKMRGLRLGSYLVVEVGPGQRPEHRADVVVHEACHWLQERGGMEDDPVLINALFSAEDPRSARAWGLLSEGTATALGQGLWRSAGDSKRQQAGGTHRWYEDDQIDPFARALAPALQTAIQQGVSLRALVPQILAAVPPAQNSLRAHLHRYVLLTDHWDFQGLAKAWLAQVPTRAVWRADLSESREWARKAKGVTLVVMATWAELKGIPLVELGVVLPPAALRKGAAVFSGDRAGGAKVLLVAASDAADLAAAIRAVAAGPWPSPGWSTAPGSQRP